MSGVDLVARVLNVSPMRVHQLSKEPGFPPKLGRNDYDVEKTALWYIRHLQAELSRRGAGSEPAALRQARLELLKGQAEKIRMANRVQRGELLELHVVRDAVVRQLTNLRQRLRAIPSTLGPQLTNKSEAYCVDRVRIAVDQALTELDGDVTGRTP